jgi:hypothetical protein
MAQAPWSLTGRQQLATYIKALVVRINAFMTSADFLLTNDLQFTEFGNSELVRQKSLGRH